MDDDNAPFPSTSNLFLTLQAMSDSSKNNISQCIMENTDHVEPLSELIFGGKSKDVIMNWINDEVLV
jgi:hypothetical protein